MATLNKEIEHVSKQAWSDLTKLSESFINRLPPVNLEEYAKEVAMQNVRFKPLISDAGLAKRDGGFEIIVNTEAPSVTSPADKISSVGDGSWAEFRPSLRFTIAHEIAHVAFIRVVEKMKKGNLLQDHRGVVERACNRLARVMLLPNKMLIRELGDGLLDINRVNDLIAKFQVSPEVFFRRFHLTDLQQQHEKLDGFIAFIQEKDGRLCIKACHVLGKYAIDRFNRAIKRAKHITPQKNFGNLSDEYKQVKWALEGMAVNDVKLEKKKDIESLMRNTEVDQFDLEVEWANNEVIPCNLAFRRIHQEPLGYLLRVQVVGPIQKPGQGTLF